MRFFCFFSPTYSPWGLTTLVVSMGVLSGCQPTPPAQRPTVTVPIYTQGDATQGQKQYDKACGNCHKLQAGKNEKAPQLMRVYGAKAALLSDYAYSDALKNANLTWSAQALDSYIADPKQAVAGTKMKSDPITDPQQRQNIIAYLSTLR